ncbi:hypothetical protein [Paraglaciecola sp. MB-3u-78]|uniref:hypothetical protein n=1 Tax=Paraglaciecola sp. MB-3u-78 TaxID=2058332 RepID=UPI000C336D4E|nr:hypothetical protein [Paraglaciecola sp. MB-3u-78]PKG98168.1 hypothetical protein CXF95_17450 [Paraglaciecola sp. MB-3u-78]
MKIAELRNKPFILLVLKDGLADGYFSEEFVHKTKQQLSDMSLRIASDNLSIIYADHIKKACEIVLGIINLGLLSHCDNSTEKAKDIIKTQGIVYCFRAGWAKYAGLKNISAEYFKQIKLSTYALAANDTSDITSIHAGLVKKGQDSLKLLNLYRSISSKYAANAIIPETDEDYLKFELQKLLNSAVALLLIDSQQNVFNHERYTQLMTYLSSTDVQLVLEKFAVCVSNFSESQSVSIRNFLEETSLLDFSEFKTIITSQKNLAMYIPEILELSVNVTNELNDDFEGGYDFGLDDQEDIAYLKPD